MSLFRQVGKAIQERGRASLEDIAPLFPGKSHKQLKSAIHSARVFGLIEVVERGRSLGDQKGFAGAVYGPVPVRKTRVSSVWQLGAV